MNQQQLKDRFSSEKEWKEFEYYLLDGKVIRTVRDLALAMEPNQVAISMRGDRVLTQEKTYDHVWDTFISVWKTDFGYTYRDPQLPADIDQYKGRVDWAEVYTRVFQDRVTKQSVFATYYQQENTHEHSRQ